MPSQIPQRIASRKSGPLRGRVRVPGDKSISHRALLFGGLATGVTRITGLLEGHDVVATATALSRMGVGVDSDPARGLWSVRGRGVGGLVQPDADLDFGNSGTGVRLMMGAIAGHDMRACLTGDASLSSRPMGRVLTPLRLMGARVEGDRERLPLALLGSGDLIPIEYAPPVPSAQVKSAVLLAGLHAPGRTSVLESAATRDHSERMLRDFGADIEVGDDGAGHRVITIAGDAELRGRDISVPGDPSSAAFLAAAALIAGDSDLTIEGVLVNPTRAGFYETLREMGADLTLANQRQQNGEDVADIEVRGSRLSGVRVPADRAPSMIDEYPCLACLAAYAEGETRMEGLAELRVKESDRLSATAEGLSACGVAVTVEGDTLAVRGGATVAGGATVKTHMDHRIAMAFLILGLGAEAPVAIDDSRMIATSFPGFCELITGLGAEIGDGP